MSKKFATSALVVLALLFGAAAPDTAHAAACTATTNTAIADKIANGHAWGSHSTEFVAGKLIAGLAMPATPKVTTIAEFKSHILTVMGSATNKALTNGRKAYWWAATGTFVVFDPNNVDCGTAFRPTDGKPYYDRQV